jgi:L-ascorbate metabolism protein UlaG (beta-lactamase superfamily)
MAAGTLRWWGHAFFEFVTDQGKVILFDPWTLEDGNPQCPESNDAFDKVDLVLISHDHFDHSGSAHSICQNSGALLGGIVQTVQRLTDSGVNPDKVVNAGMGFNVGGGVDLEWCRVICLPAFHSSDTGCPSGLIVRTADGTTIYHAGDTSLFGDMELYGRLYPIDVALLPIGGVFTMDPAQAAEAVRLLKPKKVVPMHFGSFPVLVETADEFVQLCQAEAPEVEMIVLQPRESTTLG